MSKRKIKLIIFDLDGTLVDAYGAVAQSLNFALKREGLPLVSYDIVKRSVGWGEKTLIRRLAPASHARAVLKNYRKHHKLSLRDRAKFLPGARKLIEDLHHEGYKLALASNRPTEFTEFILKNLKVRKYFQKVLCADKVRSPKPAPDLLKRILKHFQLKPSQAIYVGDMIIDIQTARRAKMRMVAVDTGSSTRKELKSLKPFKMVSRIIALKRLLSNL